MANTKRRNFLKVATGAVVACLFGTKPSQVKSEWTRIEGSGSITVRVDSELMVPDAKLIRLRFESSHEWFNKHIDYSGAGLCDLLQQYKIEESPVQDHLKRAFHLPADFEIKEIEYSLSRPVYIREIPGSNIVEFRPGQFKGSYTITGVGDVATLFVLDSIRQAGSSGHLWLHVS